MKSPRSVIKRLAETPATYGLSARPPHLLPFYRCAKRALDICGALVGLTILFLILPFIALFMRREDRGPLFYWQTRVGRYGRPFSICKLRTMVVNADSQLALHPSLLASWQQNGKVLHDPRITRMGAFLRRSSLDELPQMFNVLRGEMSLVGPRPIQFSERAAFEEQFALRHMVKPGLTGLWQISGRSTTSYAQRCDLDCTYVKQCSLRQDLYILYKTIPSVIRGEGAY